MRTKVADMFSVLAVFVEVILSTPTPKLTCSSAARLPRVGVMHAIRPDVQARLVAQVRHLCLQGLVDSKPVRPTWRTRSPSTFQTR
eukprot:3917999-Alexandrium_andersonii.AAC.1